MKRSLEVLQISYQILNTCITMDQITANICNNMALNLRVCRIALEKQWILLHLSFL